MPLPPMPSEMGTIISDIDSLAKASESSLRSNQKETVQSSKVATKKKSVSETRTSASANKASHTKKTTAKKSKIGRSSITKATTETGYLAASRKAKSKTHWVTTTLQRQETIYP